MASAAPIVPLVTSGEKYDVFLSFRGPDAREGFADCLFEFLKDAGLRVFMDDEELRVGESIGGKIQKAIYDSKLFVPIFSSRYASSKWCLKEIAWMADCMERFPGKKEMLPVFYDVDASDVKLKTDLYAEALLVHEKTSGHETVERWRKALMKVPEVKGWNRTDAKGEEKLIKQITQHISHRLELENRILPHHIIGIDEQVQDVMDALDCGSNDVRIVVIHGMGGIGKTTLASAVFNKICWQFQCCSFISNVRESSAGNGILNLQNKLLRDTLRFSSHNFCDENDAMNCIQSSLRNKNVLVVLDDVSDMDQIRKLIGMCDWVGLGSRVIITTRNLSCTANVEEIENNVVILQGKKIYIYQIRELDFDDSLQLLCHHTFGQYAPPNDYEQLSCDILSLTGGIPLALEVIGLYLKEKRTAIWKEILNKLKKAPHERLYREIMSSYETLRDEEKEIFLDIAFFFAGHDKTSAFYYWNACDLFPEISVETLISYALVKIDDSNIIWMYDLLRDLGREVVRRQSNGNLGRHSRLCNEHAKHVLSKTQGTEYVRALKLDSAHAHNFTPAELSGLYDLRFLELCGGNFIGEFEDDCLSELRWLSWRDCALDFRGTNFYLENLVVLRLLNSDITETWTGWKQFKTARNLKVLELQDLDLVTTTPDFSSFLSLERLVVYPRQSRLHIDESIGTLECLDSLEINNISVSLFDCTPNESRQEVFHLPSSICNLKALSRLVISGYGITELPENIGELKGLKSMKIRICMFLRNLPDSIGDLESLCELVLCHNGITELPESIGRLKNLTELDVGWNRLRSLPATIGDLEKLEKLDASGNKYHEGYGITELPESIGRLRKLAELDVSWNRLRSLPATIGDLERLEKLDASGNKYHEGYGITELPESIGRLRNLTELDVSRNRLRSLPATIGDLERLEKLDASGNNAGEGYGITELPESIGRLRNLTELDVSRNRLRSLPVTIGDLERLEKLDASGNNDVEGYGITELPESIGRLRNLTELDVSRNRLRSLPATIRDLERLEKLDASGNNDLRGEIPDEFGSPSKEDLKRHCQLKEKFRDLSSVTLREHRITC